MLKVILGKRYYGGCEKVDIVEDLAIERACKLFGCKFANVQPHSGANANLAAYQALINLGDTMLGLSLDHGGHLTHGSPVNFSGKDYNVVSYGVNPETELIDYDEIERLCEGTQAQAYRGWRFCLSSRYRFQAYARNRRRGWCIPHDRYGSHRWPGCRWFASEPRALCPRGNLYQS